MNFFKEVTNLFYAVTIRRRGEISLRRHFNYDMNHHSRNRDDGSYLPQEYFHLLGE